MRARKERGEEHPLFRAMVVMGSGVAVACGGDVRDSSGRATGGAGGSGGTPPEAGGVSSNGGASMMGGAGGRVVIVMNGGSTAASGGNSGGMTPSGNGGVIASAGGHAGSAGAPVNGAGASPPCPSQQWDCSDMDVPCGAGSFRLPEKNTCRCDASRPTSAVGCANGQVFACKAFTRSTEGAPLDEPVPFDCRCAPPAASCDQVCAATFGSLVQGVPACVAPDVESYLCDCAVVFLR